MRADDVRLETVRSLCRAAVELLAPAGVDTFESDFARWAISAGKLQVQERGAYRLPTSDKTLDTTLVAGMFFQVLMEAEGLPANNMERTRFVKKQVKNFLVQRLAGNINLPQFFRLISLIEEESSHYFEQLRHEWLTSEPARPENQEIPRTPPSAGGAPEPVRTAELRAGLQSVPLPQRANRKLSAASLEDFLVNTQGQWFRLIDFESHFRLNKKTAWAYLSMLLEHQILCHNAQKANRVRYALARRYLQAQPGP